MPQFALELRQISKSYGAVRANDAISLRVKPGTIHGLAGENGAGKSTLMKILFGLVQPDPVPATASDETGSAANSSAQVSEEPGIFIGGEKVNFKSPLEAIERGIGMVQQHFAIAGALTALDNIILGAEPTRHGVIDRAKAKSNLVEMAGPLLTIPWSENAEDLSVGVQQRLEILKLLFRHGKILILDEPTAVLTPQEVEVFFTLLRRLRSEGRTILLITHKLHEVLSLCDDVTVLRQGRVAGSFETKGLTREKLVQAMIGRDIKPVVKSAGTPGEIILRGEKISAGNSRRGSLRGFDFELHKGEILGIAGVEGNGQQALVESLLGLCRREQGQISYKGQPLPERTATVRNKFNFGLISEDRHEQSLWLDASIADNCAIGFCDQVSKFGFLRTKRVTQFAREILEPYQVKMHTVAQPVKSLSGGNQQKIVVAREVSARKPEVLIACQPTRGVDVGAIEFIHQKILELKNSGGAVLLISSELEELCALSDRIVVLYEGRSAAQFQGPDFDVQKIGQAMTSGSVA